MPPVPSARAKMTSSTENPSNQKIVETLKSDGGRERSKPEFSKPKYKVGGQLKERDQFRVLEFLSEEADRFAFSLEELGQYTGEAMTVELNTTKPIFRPQHKLSQIEMEFVEARCEKLRDLGYIRLSEQSRYVSATVVVKKKDEEGNDTDFRKCGDCRPLNKETDQERYQLPEVQRIFDDMVGARIFSKLDLRSGYHQMVLAEKDWSKTAFWGANRQLWEWCVVPFGLKNTPAYFQRQMDMILSGLKFDRCYIDDIIVWSSNLEEHVEHLREVFARLRRVGLKVHPGECLCWKVLRRA